MTQVSSMNSGSLTCISSFIHSRMRLIGNILPALLGMVLMTGLGACKKTKDKAFEIKNIEVSNESRSALVARVRFNSNMDVGAYVVYWEKGSANQKRTITYSPRLTHKIPLFHLKENTQYEYRIVVEGGELSNKDSADVRSFTTASIPATVRNFYKEEENVINDPNDGYYMFTSRYAPACIYIVDSKGKLVYYRTSANMLKVVRFTHKGTLLCLEDENNTSFGDGNVILELSLGGDTLFYLKRGTKGFDKAIHHDLALTKAGHIVGVTTVVRNGSIPGDGLLQLDRNGDKVWEWTTFDSPDAAELNIPAQPWINSVDIDKDDHYIVSLRAFSHVWKIHSGTGKILWKLGKNGNVQMNESDQFLFQHYAHRNPSGQIMLFDNGSAERPVSRLMSFNINEQTLTATRVLGQSLPAQYYSMIMGSTMQMPDNGILTASSTNSLILKTDQQGNVLWKLKVAEPLYRAEYIGNPLQ